MEEFGILGKVEVTGNLRVDEMGSPAQFGSCGPENTKNTESPLRDLESVK